MQRVDAPVQGFQLAIDHFHVAMQFLQVRRLCRLSDAFLYLSLATVDCIYVSAWNSCLGVPRASLSLAICVQTYPDRLALRVVFPVRVGIPCAQWLFLVSRHELLHSIGLPWKRTFPASPACRVGASVRKPRPCPRVLLVASFATENDLTSTSTTC